MHKGILPKAVRTMPLPALAGHRRALTHKGKWKWMSHWIRIDGKMGALMNGNEYRHNGGTHRAIWRLSDSIQGCEGLNSYSLKLRPRDEGEFQGASPRARSSEVTLLWRWEGSSSTTLSCHRAVIPYHLPCWGEMKACHSCPHCCLFLKCQHLAPHMQALITRSYCFAWKEAKCGISKHMWRRWLTNGLCQIL